MSLLQRKRVVHHVISSCACLRAFSDTSGNGPSRYIDDWHASIVKPAKFYEDNAAPGLKRKNYFYTIDLQGRVFLEETLPKNIATSIKNLEFLNFFFKRIRRIEPREEKILERWNAEDDYPYVSPCGPELNFVRPSDSPIVFHGMHETSGSGKELVFGGSLVQPFMPDKLAISRETGRLYHELVGPADETNGTNTKETNGQTPLHKSDTIEYGLIRSSVAVTLSEAIVIGCEDATDSYSGMDFICEDSGDRHHIKWLPVEAQPGPWSMPFMEGAE